MKWKAACGMRWLTDSTLPLTGSHSEGWPGGATWCSDYSECKKILFCIFIKMSWAQTNISTLTHCTNLKGHRSMNYWCYVMELTSKHGNPRLSLVCSLWDLNISRVWAGHLFIYNWWHIFQQVYKVISVCIVWFHTVLFQLKMYNWADRENHFLVSLISLHSKKNKKKCNSAKFCLHCWLTKNIYIKKFNNVVLWFH